MDQCVQGEGLVQINVQVVEKEKKINIVDVLKPTDDVLASYETGNSSSESKSSSGGGGKVVGSKHEGDTKKGEHSKRCVKWIVDLAFKKEMQRLNIPDDPVGWDFAHVQHWLKWAIKQFNLQDIQLDEWNMTGDQLCNIALETFQKKVKNDPGDRFWTHIELLRKCKFVAIIQTKADPIKPDESSGQSALKKPRIMKMGPSASLSSDKSSTSSGQIQLW